MAYSQKGGTMPDELIIQSQTNTLDKQERPGPMSAVIESQTFVPGMPVMAQAQGLVMTAHQTLEIPSQSGDIQPPTASNNTLEIPQVLDMTPHQTLEIPSHGSYASRDGEGIQNRFSLTTVFADTLNGGGTAPAHNNPSLAANGISTPNCGRPGTE
jgi:hypothetical protein